MRMLTGYRTWTKTPFIDFENERLLPYFLIFMLGALCFRQKTFKEKPKSKTLYTVVNSIAWIPIMVHQFARMIPYIISGGVLVSPLVDGLIWWSTFYLSTLCMMYLLIVTFWRYLDRPGRLWSELNVNSFYVYIIHVIVIGVIAAPLVHLTIPPWLKYLILSVCAYLASNVIVSLCRRAVAGIRAVNRPKASSRATQTHP